MSLSERLVEVARGASRVDPDTINTRILHNVSAAFGRRAAEVPSNWPLGADQGPGSEAFRLAYRMHLRTQDDFYPPGRVHVGAVVLPAVMAVGPDTRLHESVAAGYEVLTAVAEAYSHQAQEGGFRPTGLFGPIGAAAAAGVAMGLSDLELRSAIELSTVFSAGTNQSWIDGSDEWIVELSAAARSGVDAAFLAAEGFRGATKAFEGRAGWAAAFFSEEDASALRSQLQRTALRTNAVAIKRYPVSGIAQVATHLAATLGIEKQHQIPIRLEIQMNPNEISYPGSTHTSDAMTRSQALMSIPRCVSIAYVEGAVPIDSLDAAPSVEESELLRRIRIEGDEQLAETEVRFEAQFAGGQETKEMHGSAILYPTWEATFSDLPGLAFRSEARLDRIEDLARRLAENDPRVGSTMGGLVGDG